MRRTRSKASRDSILDHDQLDKLSQETRQRRKRARETDQATNRIIPITPPKHPFLPTILEEREAIAPDDSKSPDEERDIYYRSRQNHTHSHKMPPTNDNSTDSNHTAHNANHGTGGASGSGGHSGTGGTGGTGHGDSSNAIDLPAITYSDIKDLIPTYAGDPAKLDQYIATSDTLYLQMSDDHNKRLFLLAIRSKLKDRAFDAVRNTADANSWIRLRKVLREKIAPINPEHAYTQVSRARQADNESVTDYANRVEAMLSTLNRATVDPAPDTRERITHV